VFADLILNEALALRRDVTAADAHGLLAHRTDVDTDTTTPVLIAERLLAGWAVTDIAHELRVLAPASSG
jgi:hypothetical protein